MQLRLARHMTVVVLVGAIGWNALADSAPSKTAPAAAPPAGKTPTHAEYALGLLKRVADRLSGVTNFTFKTTTSLEVLSPAGQMINYFSDAEVAVHRPDKLAVKKSGDGPAHDVYYDGKTFAAVDVKKGVYAQMDAPPTIDALISVVEEKTGMHFPYADILVSDVYRAVSTGLTHAYWVGRTTVDGFECDHVALAGPAFEAQLWIGPDKDPLPRRMAITYMALERQPRFMVKFTAWNLKAKLPAHRFEFKKPADVQRIDFHPIPEELSK